MERKFAEHGVVGSGDAMAALAILRSLIAVLVASDKVNLNDVDWALRLAEGEIGSGNNEGRKEARRLIADFRAWIIEWKAARGATVSP